MHINDILAELRFLSPRNDAADKFASDLLESRIDTTPGLGRCVRRTTASALVRAGIWLDRGEGERVLRPAANRGR
jgi:hypothetical protein